jgi:hypothetical protein
VLGMGFDTALFRSHPSPAASTASGAATSGATMDVVFGASTVLIDRTTAF